MALTPYELGQEVARIQIGPAQNPVMSIEKATKIAGLMDIEGDQQIEFLEGYQNKFAEIMQRCDLCGGGAGEDVHTCPEIPSPSWLPGEEELDAIEKSLKNPKPMTDEERIAGYEEHGIGYCPDCLSPHCYGFECYKLEESNEAYQQMARDESGVIQAQMTNGAYYL